MDLSRYSAAHFDRGASRMKEALWQVVSFFFFRMPWPLPSALRVALLRAFGARIGDSVIIRAGVNITFPWRVEVGNHVWFGEDVTVLSLARVTIGSHVCLSQKAYLCTGSHDFRKETFDLQTRPITVGDRAWIAAQTFVAPGVNIGQGSMICAGAVVIEDVPERTIVRGNPATVFRKLGEAA
jgi:putative colanic acid biosynthesis acetyltransferase WcaF